MSWGAIIAIKDIEIDYIHSEPLFLVVEMTVVGVPKVSNKRPKEAK